MTVGNVGTRPASRNTQNQSSGNLEVGSQGAHVTRVQSSLRELGFQPGPADGDFGRNTAQAVRQFQAAHGLPQDGVVGPHTQAALDAALQQARSHTAGTQPQPQADQARQPANAATVQGARARAQNADDTARNRINPPATTAAGQTAPTGGPSRTVTDRLDPAHNPKYLPHGGNTYCNLFTQDYMKARGVRDFPSAMANATNDWLHNQGGNHGWRQVTGQQAQDFVNQGGVGLVSRKNPTGVHGHIAPIIEGATRDGAPMIANAGSRNFNAGASTDSAAFRKSGTEYWIHDGR